ncbi:MAG: Gfo/Idh/MocA family oxidoreductase [bacterium]|nr:Gfo/Idh/MocA family oxidoreductase [bacterium]
MSNDVSRRNFMKTAGTAAGVAIAASSPLSYAKNEKVRVASIGTGGQGGFHLYEGLSRSENIEVVAVCDVYTPHLDAGYNHAGGGDVKKYMNYKEMLDWGEFDAVVVSTPLNTHHDISWDCLDAGKYVFCEKTMCYSIEDSRDLVQKAHDMGLFLQVGHQRRYNPTYNKAMQMARDGVIGRINHIDAQWHRNNEWRRPTPTRPLTAEEQKYIKDMERHYNWRLYRETSGGLMTELATHALDVVNWVMDANPTKVCAYGGLDYWRDGREVFDNVNLVYEYEVTPDCAAYYALEDKELRGSLDKHVDEVNAPYTVRVVYSSITANAQKGASESIQGDKGTFKLTELGSRLYPEATADLEWLDDAHKDENEDNAVIITTGGTLHLNNQALNRSKPFTVNTDKSVDQIQFEAFAKDIQEKGTPKANAMVGLKSAVTGLAGMIAIRRAAEGGNPEVKIDPAWYEFDFETDDTSRYDILA